MKIRSGDTVVVIAGKDKGKQSKVLKVFIQTGKIIVEDVNICTRHIKKYGAQPGQIVKIEKAIDASNVMLLCPITNKATRVGFVVITDKKGNTQKFRFSKTAAKQLKKDPKDVIIK